MEDDKRYMQMALAQASEAASEDEVPIGAVIVCRGRIIGKGHNMTERLKDPTAHAEMIALTSATQAMGGKYLNDCTLYVTVEPCPMCAAALCWAQIGRIVYGAADPKRGYSLFTPSLLHPKTEVTSGVLGDECSKIVTDYFKSKR
ncbi:MAG: nucleoside deaminase [Bacteroidales bacterium]|nr:nucleoside deaminase [Bacteroidales bacterium]MDD7608742.1 nucleoside deaminase [Bacteroidales bacterium]MDY5458835.1 nucleoside deaminase [Candidatus Cryptobacteroides sp.]MEE0341011.1 nucleoside deaminase [Bacteroidales bacterium]